MARPRRKHLAKAWALLLVALALNAARLQTRLDDAAAAAPRDASWFFLPPAGALKIAATGYDHAVADWFWIKAMWVIGAKELSDAEARTAARMLGAVTDLKPDFYYVYRLGGAVLGLNKASARDAVALLEKGMKRFPEDWFLPFLVGFNYFYQLEDNERAAPFLEKAASLPGAPRYLAGLAARMYAHADDRRTALTLLAQVADAEPDPDRKAKYLERIRELEREIAEGKVAAPPAPAAAAAEPPALEAAP